MSDLSANCSSTFLSSKLNLPCYSCNRKYFNWHNQWGYDYCRKIGYQVYFDHCEINFLFERLYSKRQVSLIQILRNDFHHLVVPVLVLFLYVYILYELDYWCCILNPCPWYNCGTIILTFLCDFILTAVLFCLSTGLITVKIKLNCFERLKQVSLLALPRS